jgi:hypothetical protein
MKDESYNCFDEPDITLEEVYLNEFGYDKNYYKLFKKQEYDIFGNEINSTKPQSLISIIYNNYTILKDRLYLFIKKTIFKYMPHKVYKKIYSPKNGIQS